MKQILTIACIVLTSLSVLAQEREIKKLKHQKRHKVAHGLINKSSYYNAVEYMNDLVKEYPDNKKYIHRLADAYFYARDYRNAEIWYEKTIKLDGKVTTIALFRYAETLKYNAKYEEAKKTFQAFSKSKYKELKGERYKIFAENEVNSCEYAIKNLDKTNPLEIIHLGDHVNSKYTEFSPCLMNDTTLVFASLQSDTVITVNPNEAHTFHVKLMTSTLSEEIWGPADALPMVNSDFESNANGTFSADKTKFYFTRCVPNNSGRMVCNIYVSEIKDGIFSKPVKLKKTVNAKGFNTTQPHITTVEIAKKKTEVLFFASNRKGTRGGMDLWYSTIDNKGTFKTPVNLGRAINTIRDEASPSYEPASGILYFSSNFHYGFGGYDVFKSAGKQMNQWSIPENIGRPINTRVDDTYYNINKNTNEGFFVSNRPEGYHLTSETCCDDIYSFKLKNPFIIKANVFVKGKNIKPDSAQILLVSKTSSKPMLIYDTKILIAADTGRVADSLKTGYTNGVKNYLSTGIKTFQKESLNTIIDNSFYPELKDADVIYTAENKKEYILYAFDKKDTAVFTFSTDSLLRKYYNEFSFDTSDSKASINNTKQIDVITVDLYLDAPLPPDTTTMAKVQDEKTYTVGKLIEDIKNKEKVGLKVILNYDFDDANFIKDHSKSLDSMVTFMKEYPDLKILISAHTDSKGTDRYNNELSKRRARSIEVYMEAHGIEKKRMKSKGYGETVPLLPNENSDGTDNEENRRLNRRAEIIIEE